MCKIRLVLIVDGLRFVYVGAICALKIVTVFPVRISLLKFVLPSIPFAARSICSSILSVWSF